MNNSFSLQQIQKTSNLDAKLICRQYKLNLMADFMRMKYENPKSKQSEVANQVGCCPSTLQSYTSDLNKLSSYRIQPETPIKEQKRLQIIISTTIHIVNVTSKDLK